MIKAEQLSKKFGDTVAVDQATFEVTEGETLVLLGTSGCGKTTTLKMLNRLIEPTSGKVFINGDDVTKQSGEQLRRGIGYVLQNNGLFPHYTVAENIAIVPNLLKWDKAKTETRIRALVEKLHLPANLLNTYPNQLSGGQQQRVGLARALAVDPPVLLMDEPFGALDNVTRSKIQSEFKQLDELTRKTIIMVTHDVQEAFELGDRVCLMDKGKIVQMGTPAELLFNPANNFVKDFLQSQRLQLELRSVTLNDLSNQLSEDASASANMQTINSNTSVWDTMELLKAQQLSVRFTVNDDTTQMRTVNFEQLMSAFNHHKSGGSHE